MNATRKTGAESFSLDGKPTDFRLLDFWQWSVSDLISNLTRGRLAEFLVAKALDIPTDGIRAEWNPCDLTTPDDLKIEVKSGAYLQNWKQNGLSILRFQIPETRAWSSTEGKFATERKRQADVYIFAILAHQDLETLNPIDLNQWQFYVIPTDTLNKLNRASISLRTVQSIAGHPVPFHTLGVNVAHAGLKFPQETDDVIEIGADGIHRILHGPSIADCI